jgi:beta-mannanase
MADGLSTAPLRQAHSLRERCRAAAAALVVLCVAVTGSWLVAASRAGSTTPLLVANTPVVPSAGHAYLGAFVDPSGPPSGSAAGGEAVTASELSALGSFDQELSRPLSIVPVFQDWGASFPGTQLQQVFASGAIPMLVWGCGDTDLNITNGADNSAIRNEGRHLAAADMPILLNWFANPNLDDQTTQQCLGSGGAAGYVAAFQHLHALIAATGATNTAFVWSVDTTDVGSADFASYFPGASDVDWVAADAYITANGSSADSAVSSAFASWYADFKAADKPMMIAGTGATPGEQGRYLRALAAALPTNYPLVRALVYFDSPDLAGPYQFQLDPEGLSAFQGLASSPYFQPARTATTTSVTGPAQSVEAGAPVTLTAVTTPSDSGGTVTYMDGSGVIAGCAGMSLLHPSTCLTSALGSGVHEVSASYSGDANFGPSSSSPFQLEVAPLAPSTSQTASAQPGTTTNTLGHAATTAPTSPQGARMPSVLGAPSGSQPSIPGPAQAYLGGFVDPTGEHLMSSDPFGGALGTEAELSNLPSLDQNLSRPLSVVEVPMNWHDTLLVTQLDRVYATGAIPLIIWKCGDSDERVSEGADDYSIKRFAVTVATFNAPVFLDWYPDPNSSESCLGAKGAAGYVQAYKRIHLDFEASGASNVAFVWSVDTSVGTAKQWRTFYPGNNDVDWIGADAYYDSRSSPTPDTPGTQGTLDSEFGSWYQLFDSSTFGKPLMITGTGAVDAQPAQSQYIGLLATELPTLFADVKALNYVDAPDPADGKAYELTGAGLASFDSLSDQAAFEPLRVGTTTNLTSSASQTHIAQVLNLTATVGLADGGGSLTFLDNGVVLPQCRVVPVRSGGVCSTSLFTPGTNEFSATFSGDTYTSPSASSSVPVTVSTSSASVGAPPIPAAGKAYLGAYVQPLPLKGGAVRYYNPTNEEVRLMPTVNAGLARPLSIVHVYQSWSVLTPIAQIEEVEAQGAIPMIDWGCGDSDANVIAGKDDALITSFAKELAALKSPIFLRWYYEPNLAGSAAYTTCIQPSNLGPAGYVQAFRHIHDLFEAAGATNVAFVWAIATSGTDGDWINYYPGSAYVDWIAADGYDRSSGRDPQAFGLEFGQWYADFAGFGKPLIVTETAAFGDAQPAYLKAIEADLPTQYPLLKGLIYFDAFGNLGRYPLTAGGTEGFQALSQSPIFQPQESGSAVTLSVTPTTSMVGRPVQLVAKVAADRGGTVSFFANGVPIAGCQALTLSKTSSCKSISLPVGHDVLSAKYSGDALYTPSVTTSLPAATISSLSFPAIPSAQLIPPPNGVPALFFGLASSAAPSFPPAPGSQSKSSRDYPDQYLREPGRPLPDITSGNLALLLGLSVVALLGIYCGVTWEGDRRRRRRAGLPQ